MADHRYAMPDLEDVIAAEVRRITEEADRRIEAGVVDDIVTALRAKGWTCIAPHDGWEYRYIVDGWKYRGERYEFSEPGMWTTEASAESSYDWQAARIGDEVADWQPHITRVVLERRRKAGTPERLKETGPA